VRRPRGEWIVGISRFSVGILSKPDEVEKFVDDARAAADTAKDALGFLPERVYREAALQGKLLIAVVQDAEGPKYAGHLLHGGIFPQARIFQIFAAPQYRRQGIGRRLVESVVGRAENDQFMSVVARVGDDLEANGFWESLGFGVVRTKPGGRTTGRLINVRVRELSTLRLFSSPTRPPEPSVKDLKLISRLFNLSPTYVLDLNVLFDLVKKRSNANEVGRIIGASFNNLIRLAVTEEFIQELERTSVPAPTDPILELALTLPRLPAPPPEVVSQIIEGLGHALFPSDVLSGTLRTQDRSDLIHLATAIHHKASGFITGEKAILRARAILLSTYSLDVIGASEFADTVEALDSSESPKVQTISSGQLVRGKPVQDNDIPSVEEFLRRMRIPQQLIQEVLRSDPVRPHRRMMVTCDGSLVAFGLWGVPSLIRPPVQAFHCVGEDHGAMAIAADFLLESMNREALSGNPIQLSLRLSLGHVTTRRIATAHGFRPSAGEETSSAILQKIALGCILTPKNWSVVSQQLKKGMGLGLPAEIPPYQSQAQSIRVNSPTGQNLNVPLGEIETLLSPAIFLLPGRPGAIVPIRRAYAADLIGGAKQFSLLDPPEAVLLRERVYFSSPQTAGTLVEGTPILFYESQYRGGSASVRAIARIVRADLVSKEGAMQELLRRGVLDKKGLKTICLADTVVATTIDNIMLFRKPVLLTRLRALGAVDGANVVTARRLGAEQMMQVIEEGTL
jgi:GNAT superfamily N-acetyltransferase